MSEPPKLSEEATLEIRDRVLDFLEPKMRALVLQAGREPDMLVYMPPEVWRSHVVSAATDVVNMALNVAWKDWNRE